MVEVEYMVCVFGYIQGCEDLVNILLGFDVKGMLLLLKDVVDIDVGLQMCWGIVELNGEGEVVGGIVVMCFGENVQKIIDGVKVKLEIFKVGFFEGVEIVMVYDCFGLIECVVDNLWYKLLEEFIVVVLVCVVFLFYICFSLVVIVSLFVGIFIVFIVMYL